MDDDLELRHLRYFVAVAEELHFARAAERLNLSQPPLSQQIRKMEEILGYPLFLRTSRSVELTAAGKTLLERARRTLRNVKRDLDETRSVGRGDVGTISIGFVSSAMLTTLPDTLKIYREAHPRVTMRISEGFTSQVMEGLENGTLDVGVLRDADAMEGIEVLPLFTEPFVAVLPATHRCARQKTISPAMLRDEPFVYYPLSAGRRAFEKPLSIFEEHGFRPQIVQEASHWLTILRLVGAGLGISVGPACLQRIVFPEVVCLPLRGTSLVSEIEIARVVGNDRPIIHRFTDTARRANIR